MYILIVGPRYGNPFPNESISVTHREYREALRTKLPIFAFVDKYVCDDYRTYCQNKDNPKVDEYAINYLHIQEKQVLSFISEVVNRKTDNALIEFDNINDIRDYLRKQLAMMFKERVIKRQN